MIFLGVGEEDQACNEDCEKENIVDRPQAFDLAMIEVI